MFGCVAGAPELEEPGLSWTHDEIGRQNGGRDGSDLVGVSVSPVAEESARHVSFGDWWTVTVCQESTPPLYPPFETPHGLTERWFFFFFCVKKVIFNETCENHRFVN